jgi:hypothetical protein
LFNSVFTHHGSWTSLPTPFISAQRISERTVDEGTVELIYNVKFMSLYTTVVTTEQSSVMVNSEKLIDSTEYLMLDTRRRINRRRYNRVPIYVLEVAG